MTPPASRPVPEAKAELRRRMASVWAAVDRRAAGAAVTARLLELPEMATAACVAAYVGLPQELDTQPLIEAMHARGTAVLLPVVQESGALSWRALRRGDEVRRGRLGTSEPLPGAPVASLADADVVVVPGVAFDPAGRRLGRGGGAYDRALQGAAAGALRVALAPDEAVVDEVPVEPHDVVVDVLVTPTRVVRRGR